MPTALCQAHCLPDTRRLISQASSGHPRRETGLCTLAPRGLGQVVGRGLWPQTPTVAASQMPPRNPRWAQGRSSTAFNLGTAFLALTTISLQTGDSPRVPDWMETSGLPNSQQRPHKVEKLPISAGFLICAVGTRPTARLPAVPQPLCVSHVVHTCCVGLRPWRWSDAGSQRPDGARKPVL